MISDEVLMNEQIAFGSFSPTLLVHHQTLIKKYGLRISARKIFVDS
jgi:hypothetical protein